MKELRYLNICYDTKNVSDEFNTYISLYDNSFFKYENQNELIELINKNNVHFVITKYNFGDFLITGLTGGILSSYSIKVQAKK